MLLFLGHIPWQRRPVHRFISSVIMPDWSDGMTTTSGGQPKSCDISGGCQYLKAICHKAPYWLIISNLFWCDTYNERHIWLLKIGPRLWYSFQLNALKNKIKLKDWFNRIALHCIKLSGHLLFTTNSIKHYDRIRLVLQLSLPNPLKPGVKSRMKM